MIRLFLAVLALLVAVPAQAEVTVTFYSRDFGEVFPHAFFAVEGTLAENGAAVPATNYGFTAKTVSPAILMGSVDGEIVTMNPTYVRKSNAHFRRTISDVQYRRLMAVVADWRGRPGKSYNLNRANCVSFVADAVRALGLRVNDKTKFIKKPRSFMEEVVALNPGLGAP
jgi:hypothetical protein